MGNVLFKCDLSKPHDKEHWNKIVYVSRKVPVNEIVFDTVSYRIKVNCLRALHGLWFISLD